jgi:hypothetical protein
MVSCARAQETTSAASHGRGDEGRCSLDGHRQMSAGPILHSDSAVNLGLIFGSAAGQDDNNGLRAKWFPAPRV